MGPCCPIFACGEMVHGTPPRLLVSFVWNRSSARATDGFFGEFMFGRIGGHSNSLRIASSTAGKAALTKSMKEAIAEVQDASGKWVQSRLQPARVTRYPGNSFYEKLLKAAPLQASQQQERQVVTSPTKNQLDAVHHSLTSLPEGVSAFQAPGCCEFKAKTIIEEARKSAEAAQCAKTDGSAAEEQVEEEGGLLKRLMRAITADPTMGTVKVKNADQLLDIYQKYGPFVLRGPRLDDPRQESDYVDHAIAIMAAVKVRVAGQGEKIVFCALDCNDAGKDEETMAALDKAAQLGKKLSELTPEEADGSGADKRRIRLIDGDSVVKRILNYTLHMKARELDMESEAFYIRKGAPILESDQTEQLKEVIANNWSEVEDYSAADYSGFAHNNLFRF